MNALFTKSFLLRTVTAAILVFAAMVKLYGVVMGDLSSAELAVPTWLTVAAVLAEAYVAWSLIAYPTHAYPIGAGLVLFTILFISAGAYWLAGSTECACFGSFSPHPLVAILIDIGCLVALVFARPTHFVQKLQDELLRFGSQALIGRSVVPFMSAIIVGAGIPPLLGTDAGREAVGLPSLSRIVATNFDVGTGDPESWVSGKVSITNTTDTPAQIVGANATCGCVRVGDLAKLIPANKTVSIDFRLIRPKAPGEFRKVMRLYLDHPNQYVVHADIVGRVAADAFP